ncbi:hypothetical protein M9Y10_027707 [Tritrichomonas musculus]|uniref:DUF3447 domain-containing protein n=1 Tax=Tritrichomonas musculus TaxID=1915356 RepID=A0ABR2H3T2_9EUKA
MDVHKYIDQKKDFYEFLIEYLENEIEEDSSFDFLIKKIEIVLNLNKVNELELLLHLISIISQNHHRTEKFDRRIQKLLSYLSEEINNSFSNLQVFELFKNNKWILLFLYQKQILNFDDSILEFIKNDSDLCYFFYPEIKCYLDDEDRKKREKELISQKENIFDNFEKFRQVGQNDLYICSIIRYDLIEEFASYMIRSNYSLNGKIKKSIFETNSFLINKEPTLIEYAAFFGSIQIYQYLRLNNAEINGTLWMYAIHSNCAEMIHLLESDGINPTKESNQKDAKKGGNKYMKCFAEAIKCHHNNIANYIENNFLTDLLQKKVTRLGIRYYNYSYFDEIILQDMNYFLDLCQYGYETVANFLIEMKKEEIEINTEIIFLYFI